MDSVVIVWAERREGRRRCGGGAGRIGRPEQSLDRAAPEVVAPSPIEVADARLGNRGDLSPAGRETLQRKARGRG